MTDAEKKFQETYGNAESRTSSPKVPPQTEPQFQKPSGPNWKHRLLGILSVVLLTAGLFFGLAIFLAIGVIVAITSIIMGFLRPKSRSSSQHLTH